MMDCLASISRDASSAFCAYSLLFHSLSAIPICHYLIGFLIGYVFFLYNFLEFHFFEDLLSGLRGSPVKITYGHCSEIYDGVVSKCRVLHGRYLATPWLSSPHIQTTFLNFFGRPPSFSYRRQMFHASDGGTIALDWLASCDVSRGAFQMQNSISKEDTTPIVVVVPGLTSDSSSPYLKHLAFGIAKPGWNVVVANHRGLGGVSVTSDCFYNAGWTEDTRAVLLYLHNEYPKAPLFAVGTSIGANILVKYLGEDGENVPIAGAVAICSPWDLLIGDRFISRRLMQKLYDRALTIGLQGYAKLHEPRYSRLANWEGIRKSRSIRDFDNYATCLVGKFETVDTYYRRCSSSSYVGNVSVPLLCISALDDPVCTREAIPWDECRANKNIVLATSKHGGHLAFFEGITASGLWWVRAANEFLHVLHASPFTHLQKEIKNNSGQHSSMESEIDQGPFINLSDGLVAAAATEHTKDDLIEETDCDKKPITLSEETNQTVSDSEISNGNITGTKTKSEVLLVPQKASPKTSSPATDSILRHLSQISRRSRMSLWLLAYVAMVTSWPMVGSVLRALLEGRLRKVNRR